MQRREREALCVVEMQREFDTMSLDEIRRITLSACSDVLYFVHKKRLWGIVTLGDILHNKKCGHVIIKTNFVKSVNWDDGKARKIFRENANFYQIPVVDKNCELIGEYRRHDSLTYLSAHENIFNEVDRELVLSAVGRYGTAISLVNPELHYNQPSFDKIVAVLTNAKVNFNIISRKDIPKNPQLSDCFLFADDTEQRCAEINIGKPIYSCTYMKFIENLEERLLVRHQLDALYEQSNKFATITLNRAETGTGYLKKYRIEKQKRPCGAFDENSSKKLFDGMYNDDERRKILEEIKNVSDRQGIEIMRNRAKESAVMINSLFPNPQCANMKHDIVNFVTKLYMTVNVLPPLVDVAQTYMNVENGRRRTTGQPDTFNHTVFLFGICVIVGMLVEDSQTISSLLQRRLNMRGKKYRVVNCGSYDYVPGDTGLMVFNNTWKRIMREQIQCGDIVIIYIRSYFDKRFPNVNIADVVERNNDPLSWSSDSLEHCNHKINAQIADDLCSRLCDVEPLYSTMQTENIDVNENFDSNTIHLEWKDNCLNHIYLSRHFKNILHTKHACNGYIVLQDEFPKKEFLECISRVHDKVDYLIIFISEMFSNSEYASWEERWDYIIKRVSILDSIKVVPMPPMCLTEISEENFNNEFLYHYISWFAVHVLKPLNVKKRFLPKDWDMSWSGYYDTSLRRALFDNEIEIEDVN